MSNRKPIVFLFFFSLVRPLIIASRDKIHFDEKYGRVFTWHEISSHPYSCQSLIERKVFKLTLKTVNLK